MSTISKDAAKKYRLIDLLMRNPQGVHQNKIIKELDTTYSGISSLIKRLRSLKGYSVKTVDRIVSLKINGNTPSEKDIEDNIAASKGKRRTASNSALNISLLLEQLKASPDGISGKYLMDTYTVKSPKIDSLIFYARKKGYTIHRNGDTIRLINNASEPNLPVAKTPTVSPGNNLIPNEYIHIFQNLSDDDKIECIALLRKSIYYRESAISLHRANKTIIGFISGMRG